MMTAKAWFRLRGSSCGICGRQSSNRIFFSPEHLYFPVVNIMSPMLRIRISFFYLPQTLYKPEYLISVRFKQA
jgi:hypothetical protein